MKGLMPRLVVVTLLVMIGSSEGAGPSLSRPVRSVGGFNVIDRMDIFSPADLNLLEGVAMMFGASTGDVSSILNLVKVGLGVVDFVDKVFTKVLNGTSLSLSLPTLPNADRNMLAMFEVLSHRLDQIQLGVQGIESSLRSMIRGLPHMLRWEVMLDSLEDYTRPINSLYQRFEQYQKRRDEVEEHTLRDFAESVVSHDASSIVNLMANVHSMVAPDAPPLPKTQQLDRTGTEYVTINSRVNQHYKQRLKEAVVKVQNSKNSQTSRGSSSYQQNMIGELSLRPSIFVLLEQVLKEYDDCHLLQSHQQMAMGLYSLVAMTQARGYAMVNYAYMLLKIYTKGNFTVELELARAQYEHNSRYLMQTAVRVIARASNKFSRCDPTEHVQGDTYVMFTELLQGHIENEVDLNERGSCTTKCSSYEHVRVQGCYMGDQQVCGAAKKCQGTLHGCRFVDSDMDVCFSSNPYRRYEWLHYENGRVLGRKGEESCSSERKVDSWWRWFVHCSYCFCLCDDASSESSDRYISLLPTLTDVDDSMVLTGVKLSKHNRIVMMEVQQGRTMPQGQVDPSSLNWVTIPPLHLNSSSFTAGEHYHILSYEARNMDLDVLQAPTGYVVTGTRFRMLGPHINLEIHVTPIDFETGLLNPGLSYWTSNDNTPVMAKSPRKELKLFEPDVPTRSALPTAIDSRGDMYVEFQATDAYSDAAQMTVPYFDAQPVTTSPPSWISGLSLFHKGRSRSGGFVALQLECYNATRHFMDQGIDVEAQ